MWYKVNFLKKSTADFISEYPFKTGGFTKVKEPSLSYYLPIAGRGGVVSRLIHSFLKSISAKCKCQQARLGFEHAVIS